MRVGATQLCSRVICPGVNRLGIACLGIACLGIACLGISSCIRGDGTNLNSLAARAIPSIQARGTGIRAKLVRQRARADLGPQRAETGRRKWFFSVQIRLVWPLSTGPRGNPRERAMNDVPEYETSPRRGFDRLAFGVSLSCSSASLCAWERQRTLQTIRRLEQRFLERASYFIEL